MNTREAAGQAYAGTVPLSRRSRMDTRDAQGQTFADTVPAKSARGRTREMLKAQEHCLCRPSRHKMGAPFTTHFSTGPRSPKRPLPPALSPHDASNHPAHGRRCRRPSRGTRIGPASLPRGPSRTPDCRLRNRDRSRPKITKLREGQPLSPRRDNAAAVSRRGCTRLHARLPSDFSLINLSGPEPEPSRRRASGAKSSQFLHEKLDPRNFQTAEFSERELATKRRQEVHEGYR